MDRFFESGATGAAPSVPVPGSTGYPTDGNLAASLPPTTPGAWWFYMVTEELRAVIAAAGLTPSPIALQLLAALDARYRAAGGTVVSSVNGQTGDIVVPTGFALNAIGYTAFIVVPGGPALGTEGQIVAIAGRPGSWLINGTANAASDMWTVATRVA